MKVKIYILDGKVLKNNFTIPTIFEVKGDYALEIAISKVLELYYGQKIRMEIESILKHRITEEEIANSFKAYLAGEK